MNESNHRLNDVSINRHISLRNLLIEQWRVYANKIAIVSAEDTINYATLEEDVSRLARWLISRGVGPGVIVPIAFERSTEMMIAMLAIIVAGGAYLPIDIDSPAARIGDVLTDSRATEMLSSNAIADNITFPSHITVHRLDTAEIAAAVSLHDSTPPRPSDLLRPLTSADPPYVIYTSGTTGKPKGVVNTHEGVASSLQWMASSLGIGADDRCLLKAPYTFDLSVWEIFIPLTTGGCLVIAEPGLHRNPALVATLIDRHGVTLTYFVPTMLGELLSEGTVKGSSTLRNVVAIGEALSGKLASQFRETLPDTTLWNSYGPTEAAVGVTLWRCRQQSGNEAPPIGYPAWNTGLYVLDEALQPVPDGQSGEIYISGVQVASGYLGQPELTRAKFLPCPFEQPPTRMYRTGDFGIYHSDGPIEFIGRQDGQLKLNGIRIEIGEVETAIASLAGIARVVVSPRKIQGATMLVAYIIMREGVAPMDQTELSEALVALLPGYMIPSLTVTLEHFPLTTSGKLDMKALPEPEISRLAPYREPNNGLEAEIAGLFAELTGFQRVSANDSFFALGGTSLMAMRLAVRLKARTGLALPMRALVECPSPASLASALENPAGFRGSAEDDRITVIMFPGAGGDDLQYGALATCCAPFLDMRTLPYQDWRSLIRGGTTFDDIIVQMSALIEATTPAPRDLYLSGYSLGGDVAYGVARRLEASGRRVAFLGLIDTDAPGSSPRENARVSRRKRATSLWRRQILNRRMRDKTLDHLPHGLLPLGALAVAKLWGDQDVEFQMNKRVMINLRKPWQKKVRKFGPAHQLTAPTVLFQSEQSLSWDIRYDGWPERCRNLTVTPVNGTHLTMLNPEHVDAFVSLFVEAVTGRPQRPPSPRFDEGLVGSTDARAALVLRSPPRARPSA